MSKEIIMKTAKIIVALGMVGTVVLFVYSVMANKLDVSAGLKFLFVLVSLAVTFIKLSKIRGLDAQTPEFYLRAYDFLIGNAFKDDKNGRKTLGKALVLYNKNKYGEAVALLEKLEGSARGLAERRVAGIFIALCYLDWGLLPQAEKRLEELVDMGAESFTVYNALGNARGGMGKHEAAIAAYKVAADYADPEDLGTIWGNMARVYLAEFDIEAAENYALKALEADPDLCDVAGVLAMVYDVKENMEGFNKYYELALAKGQDEAELLKAIHSYTARFNAEKS